MAWRYSTGTLCDECDKRAGVVVREDNECDCQLCAKRQRQSDWFLAVVFGVLFVAGVWHVGATLLAIGGLK